MDSENDTIAAIATAPGEGAIAIVRLSGPDSFGIADRICSCGHPPPSCRPGNTFVYARIIADNAWVDEVVLLLYRTPHSYTREDSIEIQGHGGSAAAKRILRAVLDAGARMAEPGEFTKRAFLNGRLDLLQAEAVLDLIRARSDRAASAALEQLDGNLSRSFKSVYDVIMAAAAELEATLDFSEDELDQTVAESILEHLKEGEERLKHLLATWDEGHLLREGARVVIAGKPNVGKSTLLNALLGMERAIVTSTPGTTRDLIEEHLVIDGFPVRITDTAGLRETACEIEGEGIKRARMALQQADVILYVMDGSREIDPEDRAQLQSLPAHKTILVINKTDLADIVDISSFAAIRSIIKTRLLHGDGVDAVKFAILNRIGAQTDIHPHAVISERHRGLVVSAVKDVVEASLLFSRPHPEPALAASRLRSCLESLGEVTGSVYHETLLNSIFSRFCIGK
jgi:tRNA modification GTPase